MRRMGFALAFLLLLLHSPAFAHGPSHAFARGRINAMSPVGAWDAELSGGTLKALHVFNFGGTTTNTPSTITTATAYGRWARIGKNLYRQTFYILDSDDDGNLLGYLKVEQEFRMVDKDTMEGEGDLFFLVGSDPLNPDDVIPLAHESVIYRRLK